MKICAFGDSHSKYFGITPQLKNMHPKLKDIQEHLVVTHGATILGMARRKSTLNIMEQITENIAKIEPDYIILNFGQVDVELGYYFRKVVKGESISFPQFVDMLCSSYGETISSKFKPLAAQIVVKGINISVLSFFERKKIKYTKRIIALEGTMTAAQSEEYENRLKLMMPSDDERYHMHMHFNREMQKTCNSLGVRYYDINQNICEVERNRVLPNLIPAGFDHHLVDSLGVRWLYWRGFLEAIA